MTVYTDESKTNRQKIGVGKWWHAPPAYGTTGATGCFVYPPGFGKTAAAGIIMDKLTTLKSDIEIGIVVPSMIAKDTWIEFMSNELPHIKYDLLSPTEVDNLFIQGTLKEYDFLIVDELHKFISSDRYAILGHIKRKSFLGLTGTYPVGKGYDMLHEICPIIDSISEAEALNNNWISKFKEYNIPLVLPDEDKVRYSILSKPIGETLRLFKDTHKLFGLVFGKVLFHNDYDVVQACHAGKSINGSFIAASKIREMVAERKGWSHGLNLTNEYNQMIDEFWNPDNMRVRVGTFNDFIRRRNAIHNEHPLKVKLVLEIFKRFPISTICFNESTDIADLIADEINILSTNSLNRVVAASYHSNIKSQALVDDNGNIILYKSGKRAGEPKMFGKEILRRSIVQNMKDRSLLFLSTARALDESLNITNLEMVITTAGTTNPIQYTQRNSRGKRVDIYNPNKTTKIINIYFDDFINEEGVVQYSRDKTKLLYRQKECQSEVKIITDITDIE